jgi:alpha-tubulin suppressor-like RCC1 family protein
VSAAVRPSAGDIATALRFVTVAAGGPLDAGHTCGVDMTGAIACWGLNDFGQVGDGTSGAPHPALAVVAVPPATAVTCGAFHSVARAGGSLYAWGDNRNNQLGITGPTNRTTPGVIPFALGMVTKLRAGFWHTCALVDGGHVACWGRNHHGQLGNGTVGGQAVPTAPVMGVTGAIDVVSGADFSCALAADGGILCWGNVPGRGDSPIAVTIPW